MLFPWIRDDPRLSLATPLAEMVSMECGLETPSITFCMFFFTQIHRQRLFLFLGDFLAMGYEAELFGGATFSDRLL